MTYATQNKMKTASALAAGLLISATFASTAVAGNGPMGPGYTPDLLPANPAAGMCYARVEIPAEYRTQTQQVAVKDGYENLVVEDAQLITRQEQVEIKEASVRYEVRQPTFRSVSEQVMVRPAYDKLTVTPPKFETRTSCVDCAPPRLVWKRGNPGKLMAQGYIVHSTADAGMGGQGYSSTTQYGATGGTNCGDACEIWCLVEVPGEQVEYNRQIIVKPAKVERQSVPAKYQSIMKQVVADPGGVREIPVPAEFRSITVEDIAREAQVRTVSTPAELATVASKILVTPERYEWRQVVCKPGTASYTGAATSSSYSSTPSYSTGSSATGYSSGGYSSGGYTSGSTVTSGSGYDGTTYGSTSHGSGSTYSSGTSYGTHSSGGSTSGGTVYSAPGSTLELAPTYNSGVQYEAPASMRGTRTVCTSGSDCYTANPYESR